MAADPALPALPGSATRWIWTAGRDFVNQHVYFRKRFELPAVPADAHVLVSADTRYCLFVNGHCVSRGPARGFPHAQPFDRVAIHEFLRRGTNVIAAHVLSFGISTAQNVFRDRAGFLLDGIVQCEGGAAAELHTNDSWRAIEAAAFRRHVARCGPTLGWQEQYDATRWPSGGLEWTSHDYDDSAWCKPLVLGTVAAMPWRTLEDSCVHAPSTKVRAAVRIAGQWEGPSRLLDTERSDVFACAARETRTPALKDWFEHAEALLELGPRAATLRPLPDGACAALVLDFGETRYGYPQLRVAGAAGGEVVDLLYGEEGGEGGLCLEQPGAAGCGGPADRLICRAGKNDFETLQARGFRYVMLVARNIRQPLTIEQLAVTETSCPPPRRGAFLCSDARLNAIWETGARTLGHCMADVLMDSPTRAQADIAAARIAGMTGCYAFGDSSLHRRTLRLAGQGLLPDGQFLGVVPSERPDSVLLDYSLHWIAALDEYYMHTGDIELLKETRPALEKVLGFFAILSGERGLLGPAPNCALFIDYAPGLDRQDGLSATLNILYLLALRHATRIAGALNESGLAGHCERQAAALADRILMVFASSRRSLLVETVSLRTGEPGDLVSQHATALAVLDGVLGKREIDRRGPVAEVLCEHLLLPGAQAAPSPVRANLFFRAFVHEALAHLGLTSAALDDIRHTWGSMLDQGAATWWEQLPLPAGAARCAAWSTHPTAFLSRRVLGLTPLEPGWRKFQVKPQPSGLTHAQGTVPTPCGDIALRWKKELAPGAPLHVALTVPPGSEAHVSAAGDAPPRVLPPGEHRISL